MTKAQRIAHKKMVANRRDRLLTIYYKVKPSVNGWIEKAYIRQKSKYSQIISLP